MRNGQRPSTAESGLHSKRPLSAVGQILAGSSGSKGSSKYPTLIQRQNTNEEAGEANGRRSLRTSDPLDSLVPLSVHNAPTDESSEVQSPSRAELRTPSVSSKALLVSPREVTIHLAREASKDTPPTTSTSKATSTTPAVESLSPGRVGGRPRASKVVNRKAFQACREGDISAVYAWHQRKSLGAGSYGEVFVVKHRFNAKKRVAIKQVAKAGCDDLPRLRMEISVLSSLDHPRVLHFFEAYEDDKDVYIVTELCTGGDLHSCLKEVRGDVSFARHAASQILRALVYCHSRGVCHRDLKPENVLLVRKLGELRDSPLRLADFGLARQIKAHKRTVCDQICNVKSRASDKSFNDVPPLNSFVGTAEYMAPEVMAVLNAEISLHLGGGKSYDFRCDVWSLGVIVHVILVGELPYSLEELVAFVEDGEALPKLKRAGAYSSEAFDFVQQCLIPVHTNRPSSKALASHGFMDAKETCQTAFANVDRDGSGTIDMQELQEYLLKLGHEPDTVKDLFERLDANQDGIVSKGEFQEGFHVLCTREAKNVSQEVLSAIAKNVENFTSASSMKKAALTAAARHLEGYELQKLLEKFESVDSNGDGTISLEEWKLGFAMADGSKTATWAEEAFLALDTDGSGEIDYSEFLAAVMDAKHLERRDLLWATFQDFDQSNTGSISKDDLRKILHGGAVRGIWQAEKRKDQVDDLLAKVEAGGSGELSFDTFMELLQLS
ncbi:Calcium-dependent protein kinase 2 [Symbiodinium microadriaticum]|uniref:non-specific serine/threonine protein kinase n=1 Tax=Symbiodinium microadriaticum TaxID=2951 RepID=A0A1Q9DJK5_SYMMI|nr:Calcium-dependent protein kinase 2 [Symbiodinium microadriaticum]CAE7562053.1 CPK2 [Symbiodinium sp. KB8]CAE7668207.1 CPK2 [Symbiodinium microadriaticum]